ncbi:hypothetical protein JHK85_012867 [Glycine max]|nr:hypothetical protein JHK85_012867 [Glycine max]KAG5057537.1 hypothetical protein JHK86_012533 [Glycine max]
MAISGGEATNVTSIGLKGNGDANGMRVSTNPDINSHGVSIVGPLPKKKNEEEGVAENAKLNLFLKGEEPVGRGWQGASGLKYEITKKCGSWKFMEERFKELVASKGLDVVQTEVKDMD